MIDFFIVKTWFTAKCIKINNLVYRDQLCNNEKKMLFFLNFNFHFKFFFVKSSCLILFSLSFFVVVAVL